MTNLYNSNSKKISQFQGQSLIQDTDLFTFVRSGTNFNVKWSDLKLDLGVTGALTPIGAPTATPILQTVGQNYSIRGIETNKGLVSTLSAQNGVQVSCNFSQSSGGIPIIADLNDSQYLFRTLKVESPLEIAVDGESIVLSQSTSPIAQTNTVVVSDITDFPDPASGVITLEDDTNYVIVQPITTSLRFVCGANNAITANNPFSPVFEYTGSDTFFTGVDVSFVINYAIINCPLGQAFDFSSTGGSGNTFGIDTVSLISCAKFGTFDNLRSLNINNLGGFDIQDGATLLGMTNWEVSSLIRFRLESTNPSFVGLDFTNSLHQTIELLDPIMRGPAGAVGITGLANSGNVDTGRRATVTNGEFSGGITPLQTINEDDIRWEFQGNDGISDSFTDALIYTDGNLLETTISATDAPVKINAVFTTEDNARFTADGTGRATYIGERNIRLPIDLSCSLLGASGGDKQASIYIAINGAVVNPTSKQATISSSKAGAASTIWQHEFTSGDYVEGWVENNQDTTNIVAQDVILRVN